MKLSINRDELLQYLICQIRTFFPDKHSNIDELTKYWDLILDRVEYCFSKVKSKYYKAEGNVLFDHLNADHYAMLLYFAANTLYRENSDRILCTKVFQLNRYLHGIDVYFEVELPDIFLFVHSLGTVLGRAQYSNYFIVYHRCNVGGSTGQNNHLNYPILDEYVTMHPGSSILGACHVGTNATLAAGALLLNQNLEGNYVYIGNPKNHYIKKKETPHYIWAR